MVVFHLDRINTIQIDIPALRERKEDIPRLAQFFLNRYNKKYNKNCSLSQSAKKCLSTYKWPGNIRELKHTIERAVILANKDNITQDHIGLVKSSAQIPENFNSWDDIEKYYIHKSFEKHQGNISEVSRELKLSRPAIYRKMKKYGL